MPDQYEIEAKVPFWGTYVAALLKHLGTEKISDAEAS